jgi:hypothetical protein
MKWHERVACLCDGVFRFALTLLPKSMKFSFLVKEIEAKDQADSTHSSYFASH